MMKKKKEKEAREKKAEQAEDDREIELALRTADEEEEELTCSQELVQERVHQAKEDQKQAAVVRGKSAPKWQEAILRPAEV